MKCTLRVFGGEEPSRPRETSSLQKVGALVSSKLLWVRMRPELNSRSKSANKHSVQILKISPIQQFLLILKMLTLLQLYSNIKRYSREFRRGNSMSRSYSLYIFETTQISLHSPKKHSLKYRVPPTCSRIRGGRWKTEPLTQI